MTGRSALSEMRLNDGHRAMLETLSAISADLIAARRYASASSEDELLFALNQTGAAAQIWDSRVTEDDEQVTTARLIGAKYADTSWEGKFKRTLSLNAVTFPCLVIPQWWNGEVTGHRLRPDAPRGDLKYLAFTGSKNHLDANPAIQAVTQDPAAALCLTEGEKKADSLTSHGLPSLSVAGVWSWLTRSGDGKDDGTAPVGEFGQLSLDGRRVNLAFDSDVAVKPAVRMALNDLTMFLWQQGADVWWAIPPREKGADDFFARGGTAAELLGAARRASRKDLFDRDPRTRQALRKSMEAAYLSDRVKEQKEREDAEDLRAKLSEGIISSADLPRVRVTQIAGNVITADSLSMIHALPGGGKTILALDLAFSAAAGGEEWLGFLVTRCKVLYVHTEDSASLWLRRDAWLEAHGRELADISDAEFYPSSVQLTMASAEVIAQVVNEGGYSLLVIDNLLTSTVGSDTTQVSDMLPKMAAMDRIRELTGAHVLLVHHDNRAASYLGSVAVDVLLSSRIHLVPEGALIRAELEKHRHTREMSWTLEFREVPGTGSGVWQLASLGALSEHNEERAANLLDQIRDDVRYGRLIAFITENPGCTASLAGTRLEQRDEYGRCLPHESRGGYMNFVKKLIAAGAVRADGDGGLSVCFLS